MASKSTKKIKLSSPQKISKSPTFFRYKISCEIELNKNFSESEVSDILSSIVGEKMKFRNMKVERSNSQNDCNSFKKSGTCPFCKDVAFEEVDSLRRFCPSCGDLKSKEKRYVITISMKKYNAWWKRTQKKYPKITLLPFTNIPDGLEILNSFSDSLYDDFPEVKSGIDLDDEKMIFRNIEEKDLKKVKKILEDILNDDRFVFEGVAFQLPEQKLKVEVMK